MRLDRALVHAGQGSRSEMRDAVRAGRVTVDGRPASAPEQPAFPERGQRIALDGRDIGWKSHYTLMLHKPAGVVTSAGQAGAVTVLDLLDPLWRRRGLMPVGRLDKDTTGLLLLTTDGDLSHRLTAPGRHVDKVYRVTVDAPLTPEMPGAFARGLALADGALCRPALLEITAPREARLTLREGKYHQVKRMMAAFGYAVTALSRQSVGALTLDYELRPGQYRELSCEEWENITK